MILYEYTHEYASVQGREGGMSIFARKARRFRSVIRAHLYSYIRRISCLSSARHQSGRSLDAFIHWHSLSVRLSTLRRQPQVYRVAKPRAVSYFSPHSLQPSVKALPHIFRLLPHRGRTSQYSQAKTKQADVRAKCTAGSCASRRVWNNILIMLRYKCYISLSKVELRNSSKIILDRVWTLESYKRPLQICKFNHEAKANPKLSCGRLKT